MTSSAVEPWRHGEGVVNGVRLHWVEAGSGPLVILLHGFPEHWYAWRHQIPVLAAAGFHVVAPDMRGYNLSDKPRGVRRYRVEELSADVAALVRHFGASQAHVVGHDWGGLVAWWTAILHPEVVSRLAILNAPHPAVVPRGLFRNGQLRRSRYVFLFQIPWLAERRFAADDYAVMRRRLRRDPVHASAFSDEDIDRYVEAMAQPGALTAGMNYYRAAFRGVLRLSAKARRALAMPTLLVWGERDRYLGLHLIEGTERWVRDLRVERIADASHWVQSDAPERVTALLLELLQNGNTR